MSTAVSLRIPDQLVIELDDVAKETERSRSFHIQKAIEAYLSEYADLHIASDRLHDVTDSTISLAEMRHQLGL